MYKKTESKHAKKTWHSQVIKIFKFNSHFHVTLTAGIITFQFKSGLPVGIDDGENRFKLETICRIAFECRILFFSF